MPSFPESHTRSAATDAPPAASAASRPARLGVVVIGRNEMPRVRLALLAACRETDRVVYVDSGSTDGSVAFARRLAVPVVDLDPAFPMNAARARNAGFDRLQAEMPDVEYVQFVDGDCELEPGWLEQGVRELDTQPDLAVVAGRCRERFRADSIYNRLCDIEWDVTPGESKACGGNAMMRASALRQVDGFNPAIPAGEEPELCVRLRQQGWRIVRLDREMVRHDAQMSHFGQWWKRAARAGYAYAQGSSLHGKPPERHWVRESRSIWFWGLGVPVTAFGLAPVSGGWSLLVLGGYLVLAGRVFCHCRRRESHASDAALYTMFTILGKFPQVLGQIRFHAARLLGRTLSRHESLHRSTRVRRMDNASSG